MNNVIYFSKRNIPLLYIGKPVDKPIITLENYTKWYNVYAVMPDGSVSVVDAADVIEVASQYRSKENPGLLIDHLYHPLLLEKLAEKLGMELDERAQEVAAGRWHYESDIQLNNINHSNDDSKNYRWLLEKVTKKGSLNFDDVGGCIEVYDDSTEAELDQAITKMRESEQG